MKAVVTTGEQVRAISNRLSGIISSIDLLIRDDIEPEMARWRINRAEKFAKKNHKIDLFFWRGYDYWLKRMTIYYEGLRPSFRCEGVFSGYMYGYGLSDRLTLARKMRKDAVSISEKFREANRRLDEPVHIILDDKELDFLAKFDDKLNALKVVASDDD